MQQKIQTNIQKQEASFVFYSFSICVFLICCQANNVISTRLSRIMDTDIKPLGHSVWIQQPDAQQEVVEEIPRQDSSHLTVDSHETDSSANITTTTASSMRTNVNNKSISSLEFANRDLELREQYQQRPEKVPDIAAEMEKWYAMTDRYDINKNELNLCVGKKLKSLMTFFLRYSDTVFSKMIILSQIKGKTTSPCHANDHIIYMSCIL